MKTSIKTCFKCSTAKPLSDFYPHKHMADGHLNKCKDCTKMDARERRFNPKFREKVLSYDRARGNRQDGDYLVNYRKASPEKSAARRLVSYAVRSGKLERPSRCSHCLKEERVIHGHHHDYSKPNEVVWLCVTCHNQLHAFLDTVKNKVASF